VGDTVIIGISPDKPAKLKKFDEKYGLGFMLLSDEDHAVAEKYGCGSRRRTTAGPTWASSAQRS
jgi:peroxiredoxin